LPPSFTFAAGNNLVFTLVSASGSITLTSGVGPYGADGTTSFLPSNIHPYNSLSGIQSDASGFLVGVFLDANTPSGSAPATLNFGSSGLGRDFITLSPQLQQTFFIGDGKTSSGSLQQFVVPAGATRLFFGFADANGYDGPPGQYQDNSGSLSITFQMIPEPSTAWLLIAGFGLCGAAWSRGKWARLFGSG
jgi:hypothetical protein